MTPRILTLTGLASSVLALLLAPMPALAATPPPEHGSFTDTAEFDDTEYCAAEGLPSFHVVVTERTDYTVMYDADGNWSQVIAHHDQQNTLAANGITLYEHDLWTNMFYPDGTAVTVGSHTHIQGDHGIVLRDSGRLVLDQDGTVQFIAGKWPQYQGTTFCRDLMP